MTADYYQTVGDRTEDLTVFTRAASRPAAAVRLEAANLSHAIQAADTIAELLRERYKHLRAGIDGENQRREEARLRRAKNRTRRMKLAEALDQPFKSADDEVRRDREDFGVPAVECKTIAEALDLEPGETRLGPGAGVLFHKTSAVGPTEPSWLRDEDEFNRLDFEAHRTDGPDAA